MVQQPKLQQLKDKAFTLARQLGLTLTTTKYLKKCVGQSLDLRSKTGWMKLIERLQSLVGGAVVPLLSRKLIAA